MPKRIAHDEQIMVIGLGRFGGRLALELVELGHEVLGVDADERTVQSYASVLPNVRQADSTDVLALKQLGVNDFNHVVVGIGEVEANILTVAELVALEVRDVWAKAVTESHERILKRVGASHVVLPEHEMGRRVAHKITGKVEEYIELERRLRSGRDPRAPCPARHHARRSGRASPLRGHSRVRQTRG